MSPNIAPKPDSISAQTGKPIFRSKTFIGAMEQAVAALGMAVSAYASNPEMSGAEIARLLALAVLSYKGWADAIAGRTEADTRTYSPDWMPGLSRKTLLKLCESEALHNPPAHLQPRPQPQKPIQDFEAARVNRVDHGILAPTGEPPWAEVASYASAQPMNPAQVFVPTPEESGAQADEVHDDVADDVAEHDLGLLEWISLENWKYRAEALKDTRIKTSTADSSQLSLEDWGKLQKGAAIAVESWSKAEAQHLRLGIGGSNFFAFEADVRLLGPDGKPLQTAQPATARPKRFITLGTGQQVDLNAPIIPGGNFTWAEATRNGERVPRNQQIVAGITNAARAMQEIRKRFGDRPVHINSWYRSPDVNRRVGGASQSSHLDGHAVDFVVSGIPPAQVLANLEPWWGSRGGLASASSFTHIDLRGHRARWSYGF